MDSYPKRLTLASLPLLQPKIVLHDVSCTSSRSDDFNSAETKVAHAKALDTDRGKRLEFLLRQTEIFSHFMQSATTAHAPAAALGNESTVKRPVKNDKLKGLLLHARSREKVEANKEIFQYKSTPEFIEKTQLRDYQIRGLNWLISLYESGINGILADEMGLGKTIQTIALLGYLKHCQDQPGPHLIVVPLSTITNWKNEIERWCPSLQAITFVTSKEDRPEFIRKVLKKRNWNICLTTYEYVLRQIDTLAQFHWTYLIVDEGHRLKSEKTKFSRYIRTLKSRNRLLLTGTPLQNNLHELWALLNMLLPDVFNSSEDFDSWFDTNECLGNLSMVDRLHGILRPFLLRRIKSDVEKSLLPKKEIKVFVGLSEMQREWYRKILMDDVYYFKSGTVMKQRLGNVLMELRKACNHPYLFQSAEPGPPFTTGPHIVTNCGKMVVLDKLLPKLQAEGSRVLIFSQFTKMLDILEDYLIWKDWNYFRLDGDTKWEERQTAIDGYNAPDSDTFVFLLSTRAGGLGINLTSADVVIIFDSDWNPQMDLQATDRCHRIGQKQQVRVFRLISENTVDEKIVERAEVKLHLDRKVIQQGRLIDAGNKGPSAEEVKKMILFGAESIIASKNSTITDESIDEILARSKVRHDDLDAKLENLGEDDLRNFTVEGSLEGPMKAGQSVPATSFPVTKCHDFEGIDYRVLRDRKRNQEAKEQNVVPSVRHRISVASLDEDGNPQPGNEEEDDEVSSKKPDPVFDFQFYSPYFYELYFRKLDLYNQANYLVKIPMLKDFDAEDQRMFHQFEKTRLGNCEPMALREEQEFAKLRRNPFKTRIRKPVFEKYIRAFARCESGSEVLPKVVSALTTNKGAIHSRNMASAYHAAFLKRYPEICDIEDIVKSFSFGDGEFIAAITRRKEMLAAKIAEYSKPKTELKIKFDPPWTKGKRFSSDDDRTLLVALNRIYQEGDGGTPFAKLHKNLKYNIKVGWFLRTRTKEELHARCNLLFEMMEKEVEAQAKEPGTSISAIKSEIAEPPHERFTSSKLWKGWNFPKPSSTAQNSTSDEAVRIHGGAFQRKRPATDSQNTTSDDAVRNAPWRFSAKASSDGSDPTGQDLTDLQNGIPAMIEKKRKFTSSTENAET